MPRLRPVPVVTITAEAKVNLHRQAPDSNVSSACCKISKLRLLVRVTSFHSPLVRLAVAPPTPADPQGKMARLEATIAQLEGTGVVSEEAIAPLRAELQAMRLAEIQTLLAAARTRAAPPAEAPPPE